MLQLNRPAATGWHKARGGSMERIYPFLPWPMGSRWPKSLLLSGLKSLCWPLEANSFPGSAFAGSQLYPSLAEVSWALLWLAQTALAAEAPAEPDLAVSSLTVFPSCIPIPGTLVSREPPLCLLVITLSKSPRQPCYSSSPWLMLACPSCWWG